MAIEEGAFAAVKSCKSKEDDKVYLARIIKKSKVFGRDDKILQEIKIMRMLRNNNLMGVVDYWETSNEHVMVMEPIEVRVHTCVYVCVPWGRLCVIIVREHLMISDLHSRGVVKLILQQMYALEVYLLFSNSMSRMRMFVLTKNKKQKEF